MTKARCHCDKVWVVVTVLFYAYDAELGCAQTALGLLQTESKWTLFQKDIHRDDSQKDIHMLNMWQVQVTASGSCRDHAIN